MFAVSWFTEKLFKLFMETYMDIVNNQDIFLLLELALQVFVELKEQFLKVFLFALHFIIWSLDGYSFSQQCKDYFNMTRANRNNRILFATLFFITRFAQRKFAVNTIKIGSPEFFLRL